MLQSNILNASQILVNDKFDANKLSKETNARVLEQIKQQHQARQDQIRQRQQSMQTTSLNSQNNTL